AEIRLLQIHPRAEDAGRDPSRTPGAEFTRHDVEVRRLFADEDGELLEGSLLQPNGVLDLLVDRTDGVFEVSARRHVVTAVHDQDVRRGGVGAEPLRSEERRVGKEGRSGWLANGWKRNRSEGQ